MNPEAPQYYKSKIGWFMYAVFPFIFCCCLIGPVLTKSDYWLGLLLAIVFSAIILSLIIDTKYSIKGNEFGVKYLYHWTWLPIEKIESIKPVTGYMATAALSADRIAIKFSDTSVLKSFAPIEIAPKEVDKFISELIKINPDIKLIGFVK